MSDTTTPNYGFDLPAVGASQDTWGGKLNANWTLADSAIHALASGYLPISGGGTIYGNLTIAPPSGYAQLALSKTAGANGNQIEGATAGTPRWSLVLGTSEGEGGGNTGSNFTIGRFDDLGNLLGTPLNINRATGNVSVAQTLNVGGALSAPSGAFSGVVSGATGSFSGQVSANNIQSTGGNFQVAPNYFVGRAAGDGAWRFVEGGTVNSTLDTGGNLTLRGALSCTSVGGGPGGEAYLQTWDGSHCSFGWDGANLFFRVNEVDEGALCTQLNAQALQVAAGSGGPTNQLLFFRDRSGTQGACYIDVWSDDRIKQDIRPTEVDALGLIEAIPVRAFSYTEPMADLYARMGKRERVAGDADIRLGFVAQELQTLIPEAVSRLPPDTHQPDGSPIPDDALLISQAPIVPFLVRAIQQLTARVASLEIQLA